MGKPPSTILVCAGRRIDPPATSAIRFPLSAVDQVSRRVEALFREQRVSLVVSSAACGADLVALKMAQQVGIRFRILLPFPPEQFRKTSVVDRPSLTEWHWGHLYDQLIEQAQRARDLIILDETPEGSVGYQAVNQALVKEAIGLGKQQVGAVGGSGFAFVKALVIWDGQSRGQTDLTLHFVEEVRAQGLPILEILTCSSS
ncbi:MAG: hypothetical protein AB7T38_07395 [Nitrospirales bacterium]